MVTKLDSIGNLIESSNELNSDSFLKLPEVYIGVITKQQGKNTEELFKFDKQEVYFKLAVDFVNTVKFICLTDTEDLLWYNKLSGLWEKDSEIYIKTVCRMILPKISQNGINELIDKIRTYPSIYQMRNILNWGDYLGVKNGVISLTTLELTPHNHKYYLTKKLNVFYDPLAEGPVGEKFLAQIVSLKDIQLLEEIIGYCLYPGYPFHRAFMFYGETHSGKSTTMNWFKALLGKENVCNITLQMLCKQTFMLSSLRDKMANFSPDLPQRGIYDTGIFKALSGSDSITVDVKNKTAFELENQAKLVFSSNEIPASGDDTDAYYIRWIITEFPNTFYGNNNDPDLPKKLASEVELSALLNRALVGLKRLLKRGRFEEKVNVDEKRKQYISGSNTVKAFVIDRCKDGRGLVTLKSELYEAYKKFCSEINKEPKTKGTFTKELFRWVPNIDTARKVINGDRVQVYVGIDLNVDFKN